MNQDVYDDSKGRKMTTLDYILNKFNIIYDKDTVMPIEIPNFGRDALASLFAELGFKTGAEIGVCDGNFSEVLAKNNPQMKLFSIDPWRPLPEYYDYRSKEIFEQMFINAALKLQKYTNCEMVQKLSTEAVNDFKDGSLDIVYIDANHRLEFVINDISIWLPKLKNGGIIAGHDYLEITKPTHTHVFEAVNAYTKSYDIKPWFVLGRDAKVRGEIRDKRRSWMWVKQD